ncbi:MAG: hypothetical protein JNJ58_08340 [Chitinophagaceae bacterium]|nr:hypothetical protein [Chitinophagaceae bacterium]
MKFHASIITLLSLIAILNACKPKPIPGNPSVSVSVDDSVYLGYFQQNTGMIAGQGGQSMSLSDGRTLWLFSSAHLNDFTGGIFSCNPNAHNAAMVQSASNVFQTLNTGNTDFIPCGENGSWFRPLGAYQFLDTVFVFAKKEGSNTNAMTYIAKIHFPDLQYVRIDSMNLYNTHYGYNVVADTVEGFCYIYGLRQANVNQNNEVYLARIPMNDVHGIWLYYSNGSWFNPPSSASSLLSVPGENFSIRKVKGKYVVLTQDGGQQCNQISHLYSRISSYAWGPFNNLVQLHEIKDRLSNVYAQTSGASLHPQFINGKNQILVTYSINGYSPCLNTCASGMDNPDYYRTKAIRIDLKNIDSGL